MSLVPLVASAVEQTVRLDPLPAVVSLRSCSLSVGRVF